MNGFAFGNAEPWLGMACLLRAELEHGRPGRLTGQELVLDRVILAELQESQGVFCKFLADDFVLPL